MMMNGELMQEALSGKPGSFLGEVIEQAQPATQVARGATWSIPSTWRPSAGIPRPKSSTRRGSISTRIPDSLQVLQDLFWALLNSNEFVLIH